MSNLNRQFLFRKYHVGQSKSKVSSCANSVIGFFPLQCYSLSVFVSGVFRQVAAESVKKFNPNATIVAHHDNIKSSAYDVKFFSQFDAVLNGLDNLEARFHVNRLCLASGSPSPYKKYLCKGTFRFSKEASYCIDMQECHSSRAERKD